MSDYHYVKRIEGGTTYNEGNVINCHDADINAAGGFLTAPTYKAAGIKCETSARVDSGGSATVVIGDLVADTAELIATSSATLQINHIDVRDLNIRVENSGTLRIEGGKISNIGGVVKAASTGVCRAKIEGQDNVSVSGASTWDSKRAESV